MYVQGLGMTQKYKILSSQWLHMIAAKLCVMH